MKNKLAVEIYGHQYHIVGPASSSHMRQVATLVDEKMREIAEGNPRLDANRIAVLSAVNIADEYIKIKKENDELTELLEAVK